MEFKFKGRFEDFVKAFETFIREKARSADYVDFEVYQTEFSEPTEQ